MKNHWTLLAFACGMFVLSGCATQPGGQPFAGNDVADSWEAQYLDAYGYGGL